ncbi:MAG: hypothetical protein KatS3mg086_057 [Candidatus Dojkabacteria bacterium]|nr:MAG: hypothetical protein KatS3mg086_057 [Candidatus Dojkabacteria bacterium]
MKKRNQILIKTFVILIISLLITILPLPISKVSADGPVPGVDCGTAPYWYNGFECYIRGILQPYTPNTVPDSSCVSVNGGWLTHKIVYSSNGRIFNFCLAGGINHPLTNQDAIMKVRFYNSTQYIVLEQLQSYGNYNQAPLQPNLIRPQSGWEMGPRTNGQFSGITCSNNGLGEGCSVEFRTETNDPDFYEYLNSTFEVKSLQGGDKTYYRNDNGYQNYIQNLNDGNWQWRGQSCDQYVCSGWTSYRNFLIDTTAPSKPQLLSEPNFTEGTQNTVNSTISNDNLVGGVEYNFEVALDYSFNQIVSSSGWITTNNFTFSNLNNDTEYFYRVKARDSLYNTTTWSNIERSIQDSVLPQITNLNLDQSIISPMNQDGVQDSLNLQFEIIEKYKNQVIIEVLDNFQNVVFRETRDLDYLPQDTNPSLQNFTWDGKDNLGNFVGDGSYDIKITVNDLAGNETINNSQNIVIDNKTPNLIINQEDGSWFSVSQIKISGQTEAGLSLNIQNLTTSETQTIGTNSSTGLFGTGDLNGTPEVIFTLVEGINNFEFIVSDFVGNVTVLNRTFYYDNSSPSIQNLNPSGLINDNKPIISFELEDLTNSLESGINPNSINVYLKHSEYEEQQLVANGVSVSPLGNFSSDCIEEGTAGLNFSANCRGEFQFNQALSPNGDYSIRVSVKDIAGNYYETQNNFELDDVAFLEITEPIQNEVKNYSLIDIKGQAEFGATLNVSLVEKDGDGMADSENLIVDPLALNSSRVTIQDCNDTPNLKTDGIKRICNFVIKDFQLERDSFSATTVRNEIIFELQDVAGNLQNNVIALDINLFLVNLSIDSSLEYFSPNGDGRQDGINFINIDTDGVIEGWKILVKNDLGELVKEFSGLGTPPSEVNWDGRNSLGSFVEDGVYNFNLEVLTTDGVTITTTPSQVYAITNLNDSVVITYPSNNSFTTRGLTTVQGQAPQKTKVKICADIVGVDGDCNIEVYSEVDEYGSFSTIMPLYRLPGQSITEFFIYAFAFDIYGNSTDSSNVVKISTTVEDPFQSVSIIPAFSGVNNEEDYNLILNKLDNGQEITQEDIDSLRTVVFRSVVNQGTERVKISFADQTNLKELNPLINTNYLGYIDGSNYTKLYHNFVDGQTNFNYCNSTTCTLDFYFPVPPRLGGLYEIVFDGKIGDTIQILTSSLTIDGNIPTAPIILDIDKINAGKIYDISKYDGVYYSNFTNLEIKGFSDPNAQIDLYNGSDLICSTNSSGIGFWSCQIDLQNIYPSTNGSYTLDVYATMGANTTPSLNSTELIIDTINPEITSLSYNQWQKSGNKVEINVESNESMSFVTHYDLDPIKFSENVDFVDTGNSNCINSIATFEVPAPITYAYVQSGAKTNFVVQNSKSVGAFTLSGKAVEGRHCSVLQIQDRAGNKKSVPILIFIDNTIPNTPNILTSEWGIYNGVNTKQGFVAKGRVHPEYVHEENILHIKGFAELGTRVELYVNSQNKYSQIINSSNCQPNYDADGIEMLQDKVIDGVVVQSKFECEYDFEFEFYSNNFGKKLEQDYVFQVMAIDLAGNESIISEDEVVYLDQTPPAKPQTLQVIKV